MQIGGPMPVLLNSRDSNFAATCANITKPYNHGEEDKTFLRPQSALPPKRSDPVLHRRVTRAARQTLLRYCADFAPIALAAAGMAVNRREGLDGLFDFWLDCNAHPVPSKPPEGPRHDVRVAGLGRPRCGTAEPGWP